MSLPLRTIARHTIAAIRRTTVYRTALFRGDALALMLARNRNQASQGHTVIICPPGAGNIGDHAMVEASVQNIDGSHVLLTESAEAFSSIDLPSSSSRVVAVPGFYRGDPLIRLRDTVRAARFIATADSVVVIGADMLDGTYTIIGSLARISAISLAQRLGLKTRVLGFSFSDKPELTVVNALRSLSPDTVLCVRDPRSLSRLRSRGFSSSRQTADIVFTSHDRLVPPEAAGLPENYAIVNVSGLIESRYPNQSGEYEHIVSALRNIGIDRIVFLPHVLTNSDRADGDACRRVFESFAGEGDVYVDRILTPAEVRGLTRGARVVVTGRMHLAVMSLSQTTPVITLGTQGKVEGLYDLFEIPNLAVAPDPGFGHVISRILSNIDLADTRARIKDHLDEVLALSSKNFSQEVVD